MSPQERDARLVNQWVLVHNTGTVLNKDKDRYNVDVDYFIGFVYVDATAGMTIDLYSYCKLGDNTIIITKGPRDDNSSMKLRFTHARSMGLDCTILTEEQHVALSLPIEPEWLHIYKVEGQEILDDIRTHEVLHPLRAPGFPDDIRFALIPPQPNQQVEEVWGRILANPQADIYIVRLLNQPNQDFGGIKLGDYLAVQVKSVEQGISSVCLGKVDPK